MLLSYLDVLFYDPKEFFLIFPVIASIVLIALLVVITIHESSHSLLAYLLGDSTSKRMGRLSLNPFRHIESTGLVLFFLVGFGWVGVDSRARVAATFSRPKALASQLRRVPKSRVAPLFHDCASMLETTNRADLRAIMAPIHIFMASVFVFNLIVETGPDKPESVLLLRKLACGDATSRGPRLALARWLDTAQSALGYETKSGFYAALSPHLDTESARIEWSKVANGRHVPPLDRLRTDLKRVIETSGAGKANSDLHDRLDLALWYCAFVARAYAHLQKQNVTKARKVFLLAAAEVEQSWNEVNQPA